MSNKSFSKFMIEAKAKSYTMELGRNGKLTEFNWG